MSDRPLLKLGEYRDADLKVIHPRATLEIESPECRGELSRPASVRTIDVPEHYLVELRDVTCAPRQLLIQQDVLLPDCFRRRSARYAHVQLEPAGEGAFRPKVAIAAQARIDVPCFYLDGEHTDHFGHLTLEVLSRLWPFKAIDLSSYYFVTFAAPTRRIVELLEPFGVAANRLLFLNQPVLIRHLTVASQSYVLEQSVSSAAFAVWNRIGDYYGTAHGAPSRIYVSRAHWRQQRSLVDEPVIEAAARRLGYDVVYPEEMSIPAQVGLFRGAEAIAGPGGSGLYNCVYSRKTGSRTILAPAKFVSPNDALVNAQTRSHVTHLTGKTVADRVSPMLGDWSIDPQLVVDTLGR
ncbi:glycosyltransferase family 61 protein [Chelatococcus reniformis]|uniref:Glycosyltransferase 61 catalytic domain-containing protein n=1 Tax=Chelatococcus reniformis TaxID=1494448 RepID=A0A916URH2_9HYPH|nr:glycosyltransferase 61 family protein [Chelatococcus reniformis]GGC84305.1 hypothetical protein GCM10010994_47780 [Chelatococcus reniformis]